MSSIKFRPYLTLEEMEYICDTLRSDLHPTSVSIRKNFSLLILKHNAGIARGCYVAKPRETLEDKLGFAIEESQARTKERENMEEQQRRYLAGEMSEEEEAEYLSMLMRP